MSTHNQVSAAIRKIQILAETIRELGTVISGHLYAQVMCYFSHAEYNRAIDMLATANLIRYESTHELKWIGPQIQAA